MREEVEVPDRLPRKPKVSVLCLTYNQVDFISPCVASVLSQETSFDYEIVIRDDASTDGTQEALRDLHRRFPDKIRLILESENSYQRVKPLGELLASARGDIFAVCEGDDMWTDNKKLELCVGELDQNRRINFVGHLTECRVKNGSSSNLEGVLLGSPGVYRQGSLPKCHTSSFVGRTNLFRLEFTRRPTVTAEDLKTKLIAAETGGSIVLDRVMSIYNVHPDGAWQGATNWKRATAFLADYKSLCTGLEYSSGSLAIVAAIRGRGNASALFREGQRVQSAVIWFRSLKTIRSAKAWAVLFAPPGTARIYSVLRRRHRGGLR